MDYEVQFKELGEAFSKTSHDLISAALNYERKISGPFCRDIFLLRDSLSERLSAVYFHMELILDIQNSTDHVVRNAKLDIELHLFVDKQKNRIQHVFDDIIFNMMSLFDYTAGFAAYIFYGDQIRARAKGYDPLRIRSSEGNKFGHLSSILEVLSWRTVAEMCNSARPRNNIASLKGNPMRGSVTAKKIVKWDQKLISPLRSYRNDVIHNRTDFGGGGFSISFGKRSNSKFTAHPPIRFRSHFDFGNPGDKQTIIDAAFWLSQQAMNALQELIQAFEIDTEKRRSVPRGAEHITWKDEFYPTDPGDT